MFVWIAIILVAVVLDQVSKYLTVLYLKPVDTVPLIEDVLHLTYVENEGAAFGMLKDSRWVFMIISTVAIVAILWYLIAKKPESLSERISLALIVGGGIGNMIDRISLGYVVDMIDFRLINFAVFNVADSFVCIGAGLMILNLILSLIREVQEEKKKRALALGEEDDSFDDPTADEETVAVEASENADASDVDEDIGNE